MVRRLLARPNLAVLAGLQVPALPPPPRFWPVFELGTGRAVGAELVASTMPTSSPRPVDGPGIAADAIRALAEMALGAGSEHWWLGLALRPGQVAAPASVPALAEALSSAGLAPRRLVLHTTELELGHALRSGSAHALAELGVGLAVTDFGSGALSPAQLRRLPVVQVHVHLDGIDGGDPADLALVQGVVAGAHALELAVVAREVETDDQLALADHAGIGLVQGFQWGSPGPLAKLVTTWARPI